MSLWSQIYGSSPGEGNDHGNDREEPERTAVAGSAGTKPSRANDSHGSTINSRKRQRAVLDSEDDLSDDEMDQVNNNNTHSAGDLAKQTSKAVAQLEALYNSSNNQGPDSISSANVLHLDPPPKPPPRVRLYKTQGRPVKEPTQEHLATAQQTADRQTRISLQKEWLAVRRSWKRRKYDLRSEVDVGGAVAYMYAQQPKRGMQQGAGLATETVIDLQAAHAANADEKETYVDTSDEEEGDVMNRLLQSSQQAREEIAKSKPKVKRVDNIQEDLRPYADRMAYWELGQTAPRPRDLSFSFRDQHKQNSATFKNRQRVRKQVETGLTVSALSVNKRKVRTIADNKYFPVSHKRYATGTFTHHRQMLTLAARYIVGRTAGSSSVQEADAMENRLLQALWNRNLRGAQRSKLVLAQAVEQGQNLRLFLQHKWKNPRLAAKRLGVLGHLQTGGPTSLAGLTMQSRIVREMGIRNRAKLVKNWSLRSLEWKPAPPKHEGEDDDLDMRKQGTTDIYPTSSYVHVAGTVPPVPNFPLNETEVIFGPRDKHAHVWYNGPVDDSVYTLTLSSLLSRLAAARWEGEDNAEEAIREQIEVMLEQAVGLNQTQMYKRFLNTKVSVAELPLASYYKALMGYCNLMANGFPQKRLIAGKDDSSFAGSDDGANQDGEATIDVVAKRIFEFCQPVIGHNGLQLFPRIHVTFGLLTIATALPESVVEILSRPFDDKHLQTPFDIVRCLLEYLETNFTLVDESSFSGASSEVNVSRLEIAFNDASKVFARYVERDPTETDHHAWHIATRAGSLLLCSGNRIGSGARQYPSFHFFRKQRQSLLLLEGGADSKSHEVRQMLPSFEKLRCETAQAFQLLVHLEKRQQAARTHRAVSSFLEWRQAVALLVGPTKGRRNPYRDLCRLHHGTVVKWALAERSSSSLDYLQRYQCKQADERLNGLAATLEADPSVLDHWRTLVAELGPVGKIVSPAARSECTESQCVTCQKVGSDLNVPHASLLRRKECGIWWGMHRHAWWESHLLRLPNETAVDWGTICQAVRKVVLSLESDLPLVDIDDQDGDVGSAVPSLVWLKAVIHSQATVDEKKPSTQLRNRTHDDQLPLTFMQVVQGNPSRESTGRLPDLTDCVDTDEIKDATEVMAYKICLAGHLYGPHHPLVESGVRRLAALSWSASAQVVHPNTAALRCFAWLQQSVGLNLAVLLGDPVAVARGPAPYSLQMLQAVRSGVHKFGYGKFAAIYKEYPAIFATSHPTMVRAICLWMVKNGQLDATTRPCLQQATATTTTTETMVSNVVHEESEDGVERAVI